MEERKADLEYHRRSKSDRRVMSGLRTLQAMARGRRARALGSLIGDGLNVACVECEYKQAVKRCFDCQDFFCFLCFDNLHHKGNRKFHRFESLVGGEPVVYRSRSEILPLEEIPIEVSSKTDSSSMSRGDTSLEMSRRIIFEEAPLESLSGDHDKDITDFSESFAQVEADRPDRRKGEWMEDASPSIMNEIHAAMQPNDEYNIHFKEYGTSVSPGDDQFFYNNEYYNGGYQDMQDPNLYWEEYFDEGAQAKYWFNTWTGEATWLYPFSIEEPTSYQEDVQP